MGLTNVEMIVGNPQHPDRARRVKFLVDSGAIYSLVPREVLEEIGIVRNGEQTFSMADGTPIRRNIGYALFTYEGVTRASTVIFGEQGDEPLLGVMTLEEFGLTLHPFRREIRPMLLRI
jgi:clan AA aspartic protease